MSPVDLSFTLRDADAAAFGVRDTTASAMTEKSELTWLFDDLQYTSERGTPEQVRALDAVLELRAVEGLQLELDD